MVCASCGAQLQPNAAFCSACGAAAAPAPFTPAVPAPAPSTALAMTDVNTWAMWCHLCAIGGLVFPFGNVLGPLILWLTKRDEIPQVDVDGKEALNFQITMSGISIGIWFVSLFLTIAAVALPRETGSMMSVLVGGIETFSFLGVAALWVTCVAQASIAANKGERYAYRYSLRLIK
jgi:hypothetical protein